MWKPTTASSADLADNACGSTEAMEVSCSTRWHHRKENQERRARQGYGSQEEIVESRARRRREHNQGHENYSPKEWEEGKIGGKLGVAAVKFAGCTEMRERRKRTW